jgi:hypothetical protein
MPLAAKKQAPDRDALYVAWESFSTVGDITVRAGTRLRGNHEAAARRDDRG